MNITRLLCAAFGSLIFTTALHAQVPNLLNYQGRVAVGTTNFNGTGQFKFALVDGGASARQATATASADFGGSVYSVAVNDSGLGYLTPPTVTITPGPFSAGNGATATAVVSGGRVTAINVISGGSAYSSAIVTIGPPTAGTYTTTFWSNNDSSTLGSEPSAAIPLPVTKGLYSVLLGDTSIASMSAIPASVWANRDVRLRVWFNDGASGFQRLTPDQRLAPNGYLPDNSVTSAALAPNSITSEKIAGGNFSFTSGNVGFGPGATSPTERLVVNGNALFGLSDNTALGFDDRVAARLGFIKKAGGNPVIASASGSPIQFVQTDQSSVTANISTATLTERMRIDSNGNVGIGTTNPGTKLDVAGEVTCVAINLTSDRDAKEQFKPVNAREVLDKVARLPITEWQYKSKDHHTADAARHIGPMAQDFREAFALGHDEKHITSVDADGVALAAIQGLNEKLEEKAQEVAALQRSVAELRELVTKLAGQQDGGAK